MMNIIRIKTRVVAILLYFYTSYKTSIITNVNANVNVI